MERQKVHPGSISALEHSVTGEKLALLAVFARPEDEAFGPSGMLAKYAEEGVRVALVTVAREFTPRQTPRSHDPALTLLETEPRETLCSCRAAGINRICLDQSAPRPAPSQINLMQERLVRLIREVRPQVLVTYARRIRRTTPTRRWSIKLRATRFTPRATAARFRNTRAMDCTRTRRKNCITRRCRKVLSRAGICTG